MTLMTSKNQKMQNAVNACRQTKINSAWTRRLEQLEATVDTREIPRVSFEGAKAVLDSGNEEAAFADVGAAEGAGAAKLVGTVVGGFVGEAVDKVVGEEARKAVG